MTDFTKARGLSIGQASERTGVNIETIRYYERIGVMPAPDRTAGGNRLFGEAALKRLFFIRRCRDLGFSIDEIRVLLGMVDERSVDCDAVHTLVVDNLDAVRLKISSLRKLERTLASMAAQCRRGDVPDCPIIDVLFEAA